MERKKKNKDHQTFRLSLVLFIVGLVVGFCMTLMLSFSKLKHCNGQHNDEMKKTQSNNSILVNANVSGIVVNSQTEFYKNSPIAKKLYNEVRVLCWIMTQPKNHKKALHIKRTWGRRCNKLIFMSTAKNKKLGTVALNVTEGYDFLWGKTKAAFKYIYANHMDDADWFLKADDDTYVVVENLRYMLYAYTPETPIYFGCRYREYVAQGFMSGGAGYVLSKEAVRRFVTKAIPEPRLCRRNGMALEDVEIGKCLAKVHVKAGDSRDSKGRGRFFPLIPKRHLLPYWNRGSWFWKYIYNKIDNGSHCCSDNAISFHYVVPNHMLIIEYLVYFLRTYGVMNTIDELPEKLKVEETMPAPVFSRVNSSTHGFRTTTIKVPKKLKIGKSLPPPVNSSSNKIHKL